MEQQTLLTGPPSTALDETFFPAHSQGGHADEEAALELLSSEAAVQHVDIWDDAMSLQVQHSTAPMSQLAQFDLEGFTGWEDCLVADHVDASVSLQVATDTHSHTSTLQAPAYSSTSWMYPNTLQTRHDLAGQHTLLNHDTDVDNALGQTPITIEGYILYHHAGSQPINFEAIEEPASLLVSHDAYTQSATTFPGHPTTRDPESSEPLQVPQTSGIMAIGILATGPFDFAEIERQSLLSSDYEEWQQAAQTDGFSFDSTSLDATQIPDLSENSARSAHGGHLAPPSQMVLRTRFRESPQSVTPATHSRHLPIAPKPHVAETATEPSSQSLALVPSAVVSRRPSAQPISKLNNKTVCELRRPNKHPKLQKSGVLESLPGYQVYSLKSDNTTKKRNSRFGKKLDPVTKMTREKGACILCRHHNKKCVWSPPNIPCGRCVKTIQDGGTQISGVNVTACLTTFQDLLAGTSSSKESRGWWASRTAGRTFSATPLTIEGKFSLLQLATWLDWICNKKTWRNLTVAQAVASTKTLISVCSSVSILRYAGLDGRVAELMIYHAALICYDFPWEARNEVAKWSLRQITDCMPVVSALSLVSHDDRITLLQYQSKHCQDTITLMVENSAITLQLAKALNSDGGVIDSYTLNWIQDVVQRTQRLQTLFGYPTLLSI